MNAKRAKAKQLIKSIRTKQDVIDYIALLNLTDEEKYIAELIYCNGFSHQQIANELNMSLRAVRNRVQKILDMV